MRVHERKLKRLLTEFKSGSCGANTKVYVFSGTGLLVKYHGNTIAVWNPTTRTLAVSNCGWQTSTTKSRLNVILDHFGLGRIHQSDFVWYMNGERFMNGTVFQEVKPR